MRCTTLGTADAPTVSSPGRGDQLHRVAQSAELSEVRAGRPEAAAAERLGCGIPRVAGAVKGQTNYMQYGLTLCTSLHA